MDKTIIEIKLNEFIDYLQEIGIMTKFNIKYFKNVFYSIYNNKFMYEFDYNKNNNIKNKIDIIFNYLSEQIPDVIITFYKSISLQNQKSIALNIYQKYINKNQNNLKNKLLNLFLNYYNPNKRYYFKKWFTTKNNNNINNYNNFSFKDKMNEFNKDNNNNRLFNIKINNFLKNNGSYFNYLNNLNNTNNEYDTHFNLLNKYQEESNINLYRNYKSNTFKNNISNKYIKNDLLFYKVDNLNNKKELTQHDINKKEQSENKDKKIINNYDSNKLSSKKLIERNNNIKLPKKQKSSNDFQSIIDRLYKENEKRMKKREEEIKNYEINNSKEMTFKPRLFTSKNRVIKKINDKHEKRIEKYNQKKEEDILKISQNIEEECNKNCTFTPYINKHKTKNLSEPRKNLLVPVYQRLYENHNELKNKFKTNLQKSPEYIENKTSSRNNNKIFDENYNYDYFNNNNFNKDNNKRNKSGNSGKNYNFDFFENLYNEYKKKEEKINLQKIKVDEELGITFQPKLYSNGKYFDKINQNFLEREKEFLKKQQKNIDSKQKYYNEISENNRNKKKYSNKKRKEIIKDIEERLYKEGVNKINLNKKCIKFEDKKKMKNKENERKNINIITNSDNNKSENINVENDNNNEKDMECSIDLIVSNNLKDKFTKK